MVRLRFLNVSCTFRARFVALFARFVVNLRPFVKIKRVAFAPFLRLAILSISRDLLVFILLFTVRVQLFFNAFLNVSVTLQFEEFTQHKFNRLHLFWRASPGPVNRFLKRWKCLTVITSINQQIERPVL